MTADTPTVDIAIPPPSSADDTALVAKLTAMINAVYSGAEVGIFKEGYQRTHDAEVADFLRAGRIAVATSTSTTTSTPHVEPVGCVSVKLLTPEKGEFGMMALAPELRGHGLGTKLVLFAEDYCRAKGCTVMQLELLVPSTFAHEGKLRNQAWYLRMGYEIVRLGDFRDDYPALEPLLCGPTEYRVFEKRLA